MKKLRVILQSNYLYYLLLIFSLLYIILFTKVFVSNKNISSNYYEGIVIDVNLDENVVSLLIKGKEKVKGTIKRKEDDTNDYYTLLGKRIRIEGNQKVVTNNIIPNTFNYKEYLFNNRIIAEYNISDYEIINDANFLYHLKYILIKRINTYDQKIRTYLNMFLLGDKNLVDDNVLNNYKSNGIWHLFAISGMHISLIILILSKILKRSKHQKKLISAFLLFFMFLTGFSPSVQRVCIFYYLKNIFTHQNIKISNIKILLLTAFIIILINPYIIYNSGFQYSFIITFGILSNSKFLSGKYYQKILKISLISFVFSLPLTINLNFEINLFSVILNVFYVPFISFIVFPLCIISFFLKFLSPLLNYSVFILEKSNEFLAKYQFNIIISKISISLIIMYYLFLLIYCKRKEKIYLAFLILIIIINMLLPKLDNTNKIFFLDVGQGDSFVLMSPYQRQSIMIDTGGVVNSDYHVADKTILFLKSLGIRKINTLILSHGDFDHMGEAIYLVNNFKVEKVIFNCGELNDLEQELIKVLDKKKIKYYSCIKELNVDGNKLYFLQTKEYDNENDNSNVIYTELNGYKFMFMGDASITTEKEILSKYKLSDIDVLKVGHHGSKTSSSKEFIDDINPKYSVISVGKNNRYGHPNKEVLENLEDSKIYRTDQDGSIMFKIKNNKLKIETCSP